MVSFAAQKCFILVEVQLIYFSVWLLVLVVSFLLPHFPLARPTGPLCNLFSGIFAWWAGSALSFRWGNKACRLHDSSKATQKLSGSARMPPSQWLKAQVRHSEALPQFHDGVIVEWQALLWSWTLECPLQKPAFLRIQKTTQDYSKPGLLCSLVPCAKFSNFRSHYLYFIKNPWPILNCNIWRCVFSGLR